MIKIINDFDQFLFILRVLLQISKNASIKLGKKNPEKSHTPPRQIKFCFCTKERIKEKLFDLKMHEKETEFAHAQS